MQPFWSKIVTNSFLLLCARILAKLATVAVMVSIARTLGTEMFGVYSAIISLTAIAGLLSDFGLILPTIRSLSIQNHNENLVVADTFSARVFWGGLSLPIMITLGIAFEFPLSLTIIFALSSIAEISATALIRSFEGKQEMKVVTIFIVIERFLFCTFVLTALLLSGTLIAVGTAYLLSFSSICLFSFVLFRKRFGTLRLFFSLEKVKTFSRVGFPFFLTAIFSTLYYRIDTLLLSLFRTNSEVGIYNAALRVIDAQIFVPMTIMASAYPLLARLHFNNDPNFNMTLKRLVGVFFFLGLIVSIIIYFGASEIVVLLYSATYTEATSALKILSFMLVFYFIYFLLAHTLMAMNQEASFTKVMIVATLLNFGANITLIPSYGYIGAAWIKVGTEALIAVSLWISLILVLSYKSKAIKQELIGSKRLSIDSLLSPTE